MKMNNMKSLKESCHNMNTFDEYIEEGKVWDKIKGWFKTFFKPDSDKEFDRYSDEQDFNTGQNLANYKEYIKSHFDIKNMKFIAVNSDNVAKIIKPDGQEPDEQLNKGFWKFKKYLKDSSKKYSFFAFTYNNDKIKDVPVLIACKGTKNDGLENSLEIIELQIIDEYTEVLKLADLMKTFVRESNIKKYNVIKFYKDTNQELYNKLINDCNFESKEINGKKYCKYTIE